MIIIRSSLCFVLSLLIALPMQADWSLSGFSVNDLLPHQTTFDPSSPLFQSRVVFIAGMLAIISGGYLVVYSQKESRKRDLKTDIVALMQGLSGSCQMGIGFLMALCSADIVAGKAELINLIKELYTKWYNECFLPIK